MASVIAVDLGATSGRVVLSSLTEGRLTLTEVHRFSTAAERTPDGLRLDAPALFARIQEGIGKAMALADGDVSALGIDSWAVDYGLIGDDGLVGLPFNYRDERNANGKAEVDRLIAPADLYALTGIQDIEFNTVNQLTDDRLRGRLDRARRFLMLPDLLGYWLTGRDFAERTNASSTALLDPLTADWHWELIDRLLLPRRVFPEIVEAGTVIGPITTGPAAGVPLVAVGSHDTASAVVGSPLLGPDDAYLSSGTWSLLGMELDAPVLTAESFAANLTNEAGVDGTVRYLKNVMGMWILSEAVREWQAEGRDLTVPGLVAAARDVTDAPRFDATDAVLLPPGGMPARVKALVGGDPRMDDPVFFTRSVLESLADAYSDAIDELAALTGRTPTRIAIVGGGSNNALLCQLTADRTGLPVSAGPVEATAIGNSLIQARAVGLVAGTLSDLRKIVMASSDLTDYRPAPAHPAAELAEITALSNEFGADPTFVRAGGGNSSAKADGVLWIKPSGVALEVITADDLVPLSMAVLNGSLDAPDPDPSLGDPVNHIATVARLADGPRRPSVEILFHALIPDTYVLHTHPLPINAITCNADGEAIAAELFGDEVLWVGYTDPGLPLARLIKQRRAEFEARTGGPAPKVTFLMNHGLIVSGDHPDDVRARSRAIVDRIDAAVAAAPDLDAAPSPAWGEGLDEVAAQVRDALGAGAVATDASDVAVAFPLTEPGRRFLTAGPLIPDQIVYAGSFPLVVEPGDDVAARVEAFRAERGVAPIVAVAPGLGVIAVGESDKQAATALGVYVDALTVGRAASRLGQVRAMDERERRFIETWEAEAYRQQVAKTT
ncbi:MAG: FGGY-family carbohydrate kinase [Arachnia sp.]